MKTSHSRWLAYIWSGTQLSPTMNTSSVHLRDLNNLVSAFSGNSHIEFHYMKDLSHSTRLHVVDGASSYEQDRSHAATFSSKIYCPTISPLQSQSIIDENQHRTSTKNNLLATENEPNGVHFGEQRCFNGTVSTQLHITDEILVDSSSAIETDLSETQNRKNSLHLISELCDRVAASDTVEKGKHDKATQTVIADTPNDLASQRLNLNNRTYLSYATPYSQPNVQIPAMEISTTLEQSPDESCSCMREICSCISDSHILMPTHNIDAIGNSNEDFLAQCHEPCGTCCEPAGAVSCLEHMFDRIPPPLSCATPVDAIYKPCEREINQLLHDVQSSDELTNSNTGR